MLELKIASLIINYFNSITDFKTSEMWIEWRETVLSIYEDKFQSGEINASVNSGKVLSKKIKNISDIGSFFDQNIDKLEINSLLELYKKIIENNLSYIPDSLNKELWQEIKDKIDLPSEIEDIRASSWIKKRKENNFKTVIFVPASLKPLLFDFILRIVGVWLYNNPSNFADLGSEHFFAMSQFVFIPVIVVIYVVLRDRLIAKKTNIILQKIGKKGILLKTKNSAWNYLLVVILAIVGSFVPVKLDGIEFDFGIYPFLILIYGAYLIVILNNFSKTYPKYQNIVAQLELKEHRELNHNLNSEKNDEEIINLEVNLKSENDRMDAYVIEAALFGALAFSGFVQLISVGNLTAEYINNFHHHIQVLMSFFINSQTDDFGSTIKYLFTKEGLIIFLSYQTLLCSVFFLSVIASRLRYSKLTDSITRSLELAKSLNAKEEDYVKENSDKYVYCNEKIKELLKKGYKTQDEIEPIMSFMKFFRTLGIGMFFIILIFSGVFISKWFSIILFFISVLSIVYFKLALIKKGLKHFYIALQEFYFRFDRLINWSCWTIITISIIIRSLKIEGGNIFLFFGFAFLFLHYLLKLVIPIQFDFDVKKENDAFNSYVNFQKIITILFNISLAIFFLGFMFKAQRWPGAGILIVMSLFIMSFYFIFAKKTFQKNIFLQVVLSITIFVCLMGVMFRFQHWEGGAILKYVSGLLILIAFVLTLINRKNIRKSIQNTVFILFTFSLLFLSDYLRHSFSALNFNYEVYQNVSRLNQIENNLFELFHQYSEIVNKNKIDSFEKQELEIITRKIDNNLTQVNFEFHDLNYFVTDILISPCKDKMVFEQLENWMKELCKSDPFWVHQLTYTRLLLKNNKTDEALIQARLAQKEENNKEVRGLIKEIKEKMK